MKLPDTVSNPIARGPAIHLAYSSIHGRVVQHTCPTGPHGDPRIANISTTHSTTRTYTCFPTWLNFPSLSTGYLLYLSGFTGRDLSKVRVQREPVSGDLPGKQEGSSSSSNGGDNSSFFGNFAFRRMLLSWTSVTDLCLRLFAGRAHPPAVPTTGM